MEGNKQRQIVHQLHFRKRSTISLTRKIAALPTPLSSACGGQQLLAASVGPFGPILA